MSINYKIEMEDGITRITCYENPSLEDAKTLVDILSKKDEYTKRLWDFTNIKFDFSLADIKSISVYGKSRFNKPNKLAILVVDDLAFGEMRQFEVYREEAKSKAKVFRKESAALEWLNS